MNAIVTDFIKEGERNNFCGVLWFIFMFLQILMFASWRRKILRAFRGSRNQCHQEQWDQGDSEAIR